MRFPVFFWRNFEIFFLLMEGLSDSTTYDRALTLWESLARAHEDDSDENSYTHQRNSTTQTKECTRALEKKLVDLAVPFISVQEYKPSSKYIWCFPSDSACLSVNPNPDYRGKYGVSIKEGTSEDFTKFGNWMEQFYDAEEEDVEDSYELPLDEIHIQICSLEKLGELLEKLVKNPK